MTHKTLSLKWPEMVFDPLCFAHALKRDQQTLDSFLKRHKMLEGSEAFLINLQFLINSVRKSNIFTLAP